MNGTIQSISRRGNCWDTVCMEHFFGSLKVESGYDDLLKSGSLLSFEDTKNLFMILSNIIIMSAYSKNSAL